MTCKCTIDSLGNKFWHNSKGKLHRKKMDRQSSITTDAKYGSSTVDPHRENGPATETSTNYKECFLNDIQYLYEN